MATRMTPSISDPEAQQLLMQLATFTDEKRPSLFPKPVEFTVRLQAYVDSLNRGNCYIFKREADEHFSPDRVFHKCTPDLKMSQNWDKPECYNEFDFNKNHVEVIIDDSATDPHFDRVTYDSLEKKFNQLGYKCTCQMYKRWPPKIDYDEVRLDQVFFKG